MSARSQAKKDGKTRYFIHKECPRGHIAERMVSNGRCVVCIAEDKKKARKENPDKHRDYMRLWHDKNRQREIEYRSKNKDRIAENTRRWRAKNPERDRLNRERWMKNNIDRYRAKSKEWRQKNAARYKFLNKRWRMRNPEKQRVIMFNRNCATRGVRQAIKYGLIEEKIKRQNGKCVYCKIDLNGSFHIDHKTPISRGGDNKPSNLQLLCQPCNNKKHAKTHEEFLQVIAKENRNET